MIYVHYGSDKYEEERFEPIVNQMWNKPLGGLWSSPEDGYTWKDWNEINNYKDCSKSFRFKLKDSARILQVCSPEVAQSLPLQPTSIVGLIPHIDFEKIAKDYDAVLFYMVPDMYWAMWGWDCDTLLVLNKEVIEIV